MQDKFVYIFSKIERDKLLSRGFVMLRSDEKQDVYIFINKDSISFDNNDIKYVLSDVLTF